VGAKCDDSTDCASGVCNVTCVAPTCTDGVENGGESGVDCGGTSTCARCPAGQTCTVPGDCTSLVCSSDVCQDATCQDDVRNGGESDVDCGGQTLCARCDIGQKCTGDADCSTALCGTDGTCKQTCGDGVRDGTETDVDCGGPACPRCADGKNCAVVGDCTSNDCASGFCCTAGSNRDGDSFSDCAEYTDGNSWTDPDVFNGLAARSLPLCDPTANQILCSAQDSAVEIRACGGGTAVEKQNEWAGFSSSAVASANICDAGYGFEPNFTTSCGETSWAVYFTGYIALSGAGEYCFAVSSTASPPGAECGSLLLNGDTDALVTTEGGSPVCVAAGGSARIELYYQETSSPNPPVSGVAYGFDVAYCKDTSGGGCTPSIALTPDMLRVTP
jgi:hypothetical protein